MIAFGGTPVCLTGSNISSLRAVHEDDLLRRAETLSVCRWYSAAEMMLVLLLLLVLVLVLVLLPFLLLSLVLLFLLLVLSSFLLLQV